VPPPPAAATGTGAAAYHQPPSLPSEPVIARNVGDTSGRTQQLTLDALIEDMADVQCLQSFGKDGIYAAGSWFRFLGLDSHTGYVRVR